MKTLRASFRVPFFGVALAFACAAPLLVSACSGDDTSTPPGGGPIPIEAVRKEFESALCESMVRCGDMPDAATCLNVSDPPQELLQLLADVVYGTVTYDGTAARACINAVRALSCDAVPSAGKSVTDACENVFKGSIPEDGGCVADQECQGTGRCDRSMCMGGGACCIGKCVPAVPSVAIGGDCSMAGCVAEAYCDQSGAGGGAPTCAKRNDNGQSCNQQDACLEGQRCDTGGDSTCYKLSTEGQQCNPTISTGSCIRRDNWCDATAKTCVKLPGAGQPCAQIGMEMKCLPYAYCDTAAMTCKARPLEGEACMPGGQNPQCLGELYCGQDDMTMTDICMRPQPSEVCVL